MEKKDKIMIGILIMFSLCFFLVNSMWASEKPEKIQVVSTLTGGGGYEIHQVTKGAETTTTLVEKGTGKEFIKYGKVSDIRKYEVVDSETWFK